MPGNKTDLPKLFLIGLFWTFPGTLIVVNLLFLLSLAAFVPNSHSASLTILGLFVGISSLICLQC
jgi:hypothetical protein